jgi:hypothetical protein
MKTKQKIDNAMKVLVCSILIAVPFVVSGAVQESKPQEGVIDTLGRDSLDENGKKRDEIILYTLVRLEDGSLLRVDDWVGTWDDKVLVVKLMTGDGLYLEHLN